MVVELNPNEVRFTFSKSQRLVRRDDFDRVFRLGRVVSDDVLVIHGIVRTDRETAIRLGLSVSKKVGNAPTRNRWKRLIREGFRLQQHRLALGLDVVVRPKKDASPSFEKIYASLPKLLAQLHRSLRRRGTEP